MSFSSPRSGPSISVQLTINQGEGTTRTVSVAQGTSLSSFLSTQGYDNPDRYSARVNRREVDGSEELQDGDRVSITPDKIPGA